MYFYRRASLQTETGSIHNLFPCHTVRGGGEGDVHQMLNTSKK